VKGHRIACLSSSNHVHSPKLNFCNIAIALACAIGSPGFCITAQPLVVLQAEGAVHGFLSLSSMDGAVIAGGDLEESSHGNRVTSRLTFHFKDGSLMDETTVFTQAGHFRLLSHHSIQKGPAFKRQMDLTVIASTGMATARYSDENGKEKTETVHLVIPPDTANGMIPILLRNLAPGASMTASMVVTAPKPQIIKLAISPESENSFTTGGIGRKGTQYVVKVEIGGIKGAIAPLVGKQPPDSQVWILRGAAPAFVKSEAPACEGCPIWRTELVSPVWPKGSEGSAERKR
jgi:hypothetical protein